MTKFAVLKNFSFLAASKIIEKGITLLLTVILARYLGVEGYGVYALTLSFVGLFSHLCDGGISLFFMREVAKNSKENRELLGNAIAGKIFIGIAVFICINLLAYKLDYSYQTWTSILIYSISMVFLLFSNIFRSLFIAMERAYLEGIMVISARVLLLAGVVVLVSFNAVLPGIMTAHLTSSIIILAAGYLVSRNLFFAPSWNIDFESVKKLLKESFPFAIGAIMGEIYFNIDTVMISKMVGLKATGYYNAAYKLSFSGVLFANTITLILYPHIARKWTKKKEDVYKLFSKLCKVLIISGCLLSLFASVFSYHIIDIVYGSEFIKSVTLFRILAWSLPPLFLIHLTIRTLEGIGEEKIVAKTMSLSVIINIALNYVLIQNFGAIGASVATVLTAIFIVASHLVFLIKKFAFTGPFYLFTNK